MDPTAVLSRGYTITRDPDTGRILRRAGDLVERDRILVQFAQDRLTARVETIEGEATKETKGKRREDP